MSADTIASLYTMMINSQDFMDLVAEDPSVLDKYSDLTSEERDLLVEVAGREVEGFSYSSNGVIGYIGRNLPLSKNVGSSLGVALAGMQGLSPRSILGGGADCDCCKWKGGFQAGAWVSNPAP